MRGEDSKQEAMLSYVSPETRIPLKHPLRPIKAMVSEALADDRLEQLAGDIRLEQPIAVLLIEFPFGDIYSRPQLSRAHLFSCVLEELQWPHGYQFRYMDSSRKINGLRLAPESKGSRDPSAPARSTLLLLR